MHRLGIALALGACLGLAACGEAQPSRTTVQDVKARQADNGAAKARQVLEHNGGVNAEQDNIQRRLALTMNPGQIGFIMLLNAAGQPIAYYGVKGKLTSGSKRLTAPEIFGMHDCGEYRCDSTVTAPNDDGTYGQSDSYLFFWDTDGAYHQWSGDYLYSDRPFRTRVAPLVISLNG